MISIILPVLNGMPLLQKSIDSILNQSYKNFQLIIINDGSTDKTSQYLNSLSDSRIIIYEQQNQGLPQSLNIGLKMVTGEFITWTSHDNYYHTNALEFMRDALLKNKQSDFVYGGHRVFGTSKRDVRGFQNPREFMFNFRGMACFMWRSYLTDKIGFFDENLTGIEDYDYWLRILKYNPKFTSINKILYFYKKGKNTMTSKIKDNYKSLRTKLANKILKENKILNIDTFYPFISECVDVERARYIASRDLLKIIDNSTNVVFKNKFKSFTDKLRNNAKLVNLNIDNLVEEELFIIEKGQFESYNM